MLPPEECEKAIIYTVTITITAITIAVNAAVAIATFTRAKFVTATLGEVSVPDSWLPKLATLQLAGSAGLLLGLLGVPIVGVTAAIGLVLFYLGALVTHMRANAYQSMASPVLFLVLAAGTLVLMLL